ncbi:MAG: A/G-specific adenine glycosylase [Dehalococcoidia bacterium]|nr:A/G-specific adenine glycosylase [Dehalococcoidia bacterium]
MTKVSLAPPGRRALQRSLLAWYARGHRDLPWRGTRDPYAILVSEVMLQQTQADRVAPKFTEFLALFPDFEALAHAPPAGVIRAWAPLGYNRRAVRLQRIAQRVVGEMGERLPATAEALRQLDGVGDYTAAAVASFAFGEHIAVVDVNVRRVVTRLLWGDGTPAPREIAQAAQELLPRRQACDWNQAMMELGAVLCVKRKPRCSDCPVRRHCRAAPLLAQGEMRIAETKAGYKATPFKETRRYFRGRMVEALRALPLGGWLTLTQLGAAVKPGYGPDDEPWLAGVAAALAREGLARVGEVRGVTRLSLP